ncbi:hypothetical protein [Rhizohabitans arisaemae]|uniref:hypothetical protein n=1 Tax=Rhizohabitans arisaemae TaxID=2720610 RepID=UPI0024B20663|nr:hypothetical protein [Rhizohabitans arisaemae]
MTARPGRTALIAGITGGAAGLLTGLALPEPPTGGLILHTVVAVLLGAGFGLLATRQNPADLLYWGLAYGAGWWLLGTLTLLPLLDGGPVAWTLPDARLRLPQLIGLLVYGMGTAAVLTAVHGGVLRGITPRRLLRGATAGLAAALLLIPLTDTMTGGILITTGIIAGLLYPTLFAGPALGSGPALVRGVPYGFLCWILAGLSLPALLDGAPGAHWTLAAAQAALPRLPAYLLLGAGIALVDNALRSLGRLLFADDIRRLRREGAGTRGVRALAYGALAGLTGGLLFTVVMVGIGVLDTVARLVGATSVWTGLLVHLLISQAIGVSYALLFHRRSYDLASGIGWGASYGFLWWILGGVTLFPILLGSTPKWDAAGLASAFPSLVGHLTYGAALGVVYHLLESRTNPWWLTRNTLQTARVTTEREQTLGSAPALWTLTVLIATTIPLLTTPPG